MKCCSSERNVEGPKVLLVCVHNVFECTTSRYLCVVIIVCSIQILLQKCMSIVYMRKTRVLVVSKQSSPAAIDSRVMALELLLLFFFRFSA